MNMLEKINPALLADNPIDFNQVSDIKLRTGLPPCAVVGGLSVNINSQPLALEDLDQIMTRLLSESDAAIYLKGGLGLMFSAKFAGMDFSILGSRESRQASFWLRILHVER